MPLYEYECDACGRRFERIQKFSDPPVATCPACGGAVKRLVSSPAIQFKGSGWYITDYARKGTDKPAKDDKAPKATESTSDSKTTDTKTPAASDSSKPATSTTGGDNKK
jgi:putative FmdB family regulatory protein